MCQDLPTELYRRWKFDTDEQKFKFRHNRLRNFARKQDQYLKVKVFSYLENRQKSTILMLMVTAITVRQCLKQWDVTTTPVPVKKLVPP